MEEKQNWLAIAAVVLVVAGLGVFLYRQSQQQSPEAEAVSEEEEATQRADDLLESMDVTIPEDAERVNLRDVSGGEGAGVATRREEESGEVTQSLLVALPEPESGSFYEAYLTSESNEEPLYLGKLRSVKGGWMLDYSLSESDAGYTTIQVTHEQTDDRQPEEVIMEGAFSDPASEETETTDEATEAETNEEASSEDDTNQESVESN